MNAFWALCEKLCSEKHFSINILSGICMLSKKHRLCHQSTQEFKMLKGNVSGEFSVCTITDIIAAAATLVNKFMVWINEECQASQNHFCRIKATTNTQSKWHTVWCTNNVKRVALFPSIHAIFYSRPHPDGKRFSSRIHKVCSTRSVVSMKT